MKQTLGVHRFIRISFFSILSSLAILAFFSTSTFAQGSRGGSGGGATSVSTGRFEAFMSAGYIGISSSAKEFDIAPGFQMIPISQFSWFQVGAEITYQKMSYRGSGASNVLFLGGPTFNLGGATVNDSFFASLGPVIRAGSSDLPDLASVNPNGFGFFFFVGKRFPISGGIALRPSMGVISAGSTGMIFRPFAMSFHF